MVKTFKLEILASDHVFYSGECDELIFPGQDGSFGILPNHQPMITCLNAGELRFRTGDQWHYAVVSDGFVEIMPSYVTLLADTVERPEEIDEKRARAPGATAGQPRKRAPAGRSEKPGSALDQAVGQAGGKITHLIAQLAQRGLGLTPQTAAGVGQDVAGALLGRAHDALLFRQARVAAFLTGKTGVLTGTGQFGFVVGEAFGGLGLKAVGFAGQVVHDAVALFDYFADGSDQEDVEYKDGDKEVHQLKDQGDIEIQHAASSLKMAV